MNCYSQCVPMLFLCCALCAGQAAAQEAGGPAALANGLPAEEAARRMTVPDGFRVQLAAAEPQVHQPIALAIDPRGRLWVAEAYTYPRRAREGQGRDKIIILEDTNGDGSLDRRTEFASGLNLVSGLEVGFGGVWVGAAPYLMFIPDRNGDDRPDSDPQILLDGFGYQDTHETLNSFNWGPDGWLYGCHGIFTRSEVGRPGTPASERIPVNAAIWRFHPVRHEFEVFAWGTSNPWGVDFDDHGQAFCTACVIPHLYHVIQGARYQRQAGNHFNPYVFDDIKTIADHLHYTGDIREHAWWGQEPALPPATSETGGGHAHCGAMIYLADNWPAQYRNQIFFHNIHGNRVNRDLLQRHGSGFVGRHGSDFLLANDRWFRGINLRYGPDGTVYLIDWYDPNACHRADPEIWDRSNGRIYRVEYVGEAGATGRAPREPVNLSLLDNDQLVELQRHRNDWYVRTARRLLQQRGGSPAVYARLRELVLGNGSAAQRLRALWALHATGGLDRPLVERLLADQDAYLRAWAIQLEMEDRSVSQPLLERMLGLCRDDPSPLVRLYLASALQRLPAAERWPLIEALAAHGEDAGDPNLPLMIWYALEPLVTADPARAIRLAERTPIERLSRYVTRRAAFDPAGLDHVVSWLAEVASDRRRTMILGEMLEAFRGRVDVGTPAAWRRSYEQLAASGDAGVVDLAQQAAVMLGDREILSQMRQLVADGAAPLPRRARALRILVQGRDAEAAPALHDALDTPSLRGSALRALATLDHPYTPAAILGRYAEYDANQRRDALATLVTRPSYAMELMKAIQAEQVPRTDLHAYHIRQLLRFESPELRRQLEQVWGAIRESSADTRSAIARWKQELTPAALAQASVSHGRQLFNQHCASCHTLFGSGEQVGPDITGADRANLDYLLENVLDPSAVLGNDYRMTVIATTDGRIISGLIQNETDSALTVRTINDALVVAKREIEERQLSDQSLMPDRLLDPLSTSEVRDLIAYLQSRRQVELPAGADTQ